METAKLTENFLSAAELHAARFKPRSQFASSLPVFGCCARGSAKRLREMALVGETCLQRDIRNGFLAKQQKFLCPLDPDVERPFIWRHAVFVAELRPSFAQVR